MTSYLDLDYSLVRACLEYKQYAWEDFVDRFMDLVLRVIEHTARVRAREIPEEEKLELCEAIFRSFRYNDFQLLREFAFHSAFSTYLTVLSYRLAIAFLSED